VRERKSSNGRPPTRMFSNLSWEEAEGGSEKKVKIRVSVSHSGIKKESGQGLLQDNKNWALPGAKRENRSPGTGHRQKTWVEKTTGSAVTNGGPTLWKIKGEHLSTGNGLITENGRGHHTGNLRQKR